MVAAQQPLHSALAAWVLARWYGSFDCWQDVYPLIDTMLDDPAALAILANQGPFLLAFSAAINCKQPERAMALLKREDWPQTTDKALAASMLQQGADKLRTLSQVFEQQGLMGLADDSGALLSTLKAGTLKASTLKANTLPAKISDLWQPLVSVIVPCFNAAATIGYALDSLLRQSWRKLQIIVVDDASSDNSADIVQQIAALDSRITLLRQTVNQGAYAVRNIGLSAARGRFITVHDSDDWSHPQKIALQVAALQANRNAMASISHWVRCTDALQFGHWRVEDSWTYRNTSSLLYRRRVVKQLGFWDRVSVGADTEYMLRTLKHYGEQAVVDVKPGLPLSFGLADVKSLTQTKATHLRTQFNGLRCDYRNAAMQWHNAADSLYIPASLTQRPFAVPPRMCRGSEAVQQHNLMLILEQKQLFDSDWYLTNNPDVAKAGANPLQHFVYHGAAEGRDPLPGFSLSGYALSQQLPLAQALAHWLTPGKPVSGPIWLKQQTLPGSQQHMVLVAHAAASELYGAERSLIDVLQQLSQLQLSLTVILPSANNPDYIRQLMPWCQRLLVLPYGWWRADRALCQPTLACFTTLFQQLHADVVYQNTCVLYEPLVAARQLQLRTIMHVREVADTDADLCRQLAATANQVAQHIQQHADVVIANSAAVACFVNSPERTVTLPNTLSAALRQCSARPNGSRLQLGMISSNSAKKGIADFFAMAEQAHGRGLPVDFVLFGPNSAALQQLMQQYAGLVRYAGYVAAPEQALAQLDAVVNLSQVAESFGRTVLEALATSRLVLAYRHGALAEWLPAELCLLAEVGNWPLLLTQLEALLAEPLSLKKILQLGATFAWQHYAPEHVLPIWQQLLNVQQRG
nr:glycosyltransferase [Rheinheimera maricola]